ncbi:MAG: transglutaminase family protein [Deltaproteobacteria bacterium]|nr:transglutaminase family protein [Deltaproteobacteria bacterium]
MKSTDRRAPAAAAAEPASLLAPGRFVDCDHPDVVAYARAAAGDAATERERAARLFRAVRDGFRYDPYTFSLDPADYRASVIVHRAATFCVPKAIVLCAGARALGIPARLGFADVRNHLQGARLRRLMGTDVFAFHGFAELYLGGRWLKAAPAFNAELCRRFGVPPLEFDGRSDALLQQHTPDGRQYMEYVRQRGSHADLPFDEMVAAFREIYGSLAALGEGVHDEVFHNA